MPKETRREVRNEIRAVAEPFAREAQARFINAVGPDSRGRIHSRYGVSVRKVGTVSVEQRARSKQSPRNRRLRRPKFTTLQWNKALGPATDHAAERMGRDMNHLLDKLEHKWSRG